ncbi:MAG: hypothetical protein OXE78_05705 [Gammaproteobacteria bacterium]|nr:hypothetical protein [Gammaproteobacteria bacterium]MCY4358652.1 hypothetical protein [Gammaproteobacteria bacterium]
MLLIATLLTLRVTGLDPRYIDPTTEAYEEVGRTAWPGLWLSGEVVREPVTNWDFINEVNHPVRGNAVMLETLSWFGLPHSVTIYAIPRGERLYVGGSRRDSRLEKPFPHSKRWWANMERDPRVRMKIDGKIYELTVVRIADRDKLREAINREPFLTRLDENGREEIYGYWHYWEAFQRGVEDYGGDS